MLKTNKKTLIITSVITVLPMLIGVFFWNRLPDMMATHFGSNNMANGFSSKPFAVFGIPLICLAVLWVGAFVTAHDPRKQNITPKMFTLCLWIAPIISLVVAGTMYPINLGYSVNPAYVGELFVSVILIVIGNYMPKARQNYTIGIKLPWTLANEENWNRTHRLAGYLWMICGILMVVLTLCKALQPGWMIAAIAIIVIIPFLYSFWLHTGKSL